MQKVITPLLNEGKSYGILAALFAIGTAGMGGVVPYLQTVVVISLIGMVSWLPFIKRAENPVVRFGLVPALYVGMSFFYAIVRLRTQGVFTKDGAYETFLQHYGVAILINFATAVLAGAIAPLLSKKIEIGRRKTHASTRLG